ncbi:MAG: hypothetical protein V3V95_07910, partial [Thermodesulfobacteriota bacterium]
AVKELISGALLITLIYWLFGGNIPLVFAILFPLIYFALCVVIKVINLSDLRVILPKGCLSRSSV